VCQSGKECEKFKETKVLRGIFSGTPHLPRRIWCVCGLLGILRWSVYSVDASRTDWPFSGQSSAAASLPVTQEHSFAGTANTSAL